MATKSINQHETATVSSANDYNVLVQGQSATQHKKMNAGDLAVGIVADSYKNTQPYAVGDKAIHNGVLYKCTTAITTAEEWDSAHWTATLAVNEGGGGSTEDCLKKTGTQTIVNSTGNTDASLIVRPTASGMPMAKMSASDDNSLYFALYKMVSSVLNSTVFLNDKITVTVGDTTYNVPYADIKSVIDNALRNAGTQTINYDGANPSKLILKDNSATPQNSIEIDGTTGNPEFVIKKNANISVRLIADRIIFFNNDTMFGLQILFSDIYGIVKNKGGYHLTTSASSTVTLNPNNPVMITGNVTSVVLNFTTPIANADNEYKVYFTTGSGTLTFTPNYPSGYSVKGDTVTLSANKTYEISYSVIAENTLGCALKEYS